MTEDVRAAAERLRRIQNGERDYQVYPSKVRGTDPTHLDKDTLVRAYLAEHPADDGGPVTPEWLRAVGFAEEDLGWQTCPLTGRPPNAFAIGGARDGQYHHLGVWAGDGRWATYHLTADGFDGSETWLAWAETRGAVRRLCAALGVVLKGAP